MAPNRNNNIEIIESYAFNNLPSLKTIIIPHSTKFIDEASFNNCPNLTINCMHFYKPANWSVNWNQSNNKVVWGYTE